MPALKPNPAARASPAQAAPPSFHAGRFGIESAQLSNLSGRRAGGTAPEGRNMAKPRTLYDKIWDDHVIETQGGNSLIYIDRHLVHEVTSPQAFEGLRMSGPQGARAGEDARRRRPQHPDHRPQRRHRRPREPPAGRDASRQRHANSASNITTSSTPARASSTSSAPSRVSPCPARPSSAATATPRPTAPSARSRTASARPRSSTCWRPRR